MSQFGWGPFLGLNARGPLYIVVGLNVAYLYYCAFFETASSENCCLLREQKNNPVSTIIAQSLKPHPRKMPHATRKIISAYFHIYDAFSSAYSTLSVIHSIAVKNDQK